MRCELSFFGMLFHGELQNYSRAHNQNTKLETKRQEVVSIIECYKDFHLYDKFLLFSTYSRIRLNRKKILAKQSEFSLIRADKILMLSLMTLGTNLVIMSDEKRIL